MKPATNFGLNSAAPELKSPSAAALSQQGRCAGLEPSCARGGKLLRSATHIVAKRTKLRGGTRTEVCVPLETQHSGNVEHGSRRATYDDKMSDERSAGLGSADPSDATGA